MKRSYYVCFFSLFCFILLLIFVLFNKVSFFDDAIYHNIFSIRNGFFDIFFKIVTKFSNTIPVICFVLLWMIFLPKKEKYIFGSGIVSTVIVNQIIKYLVQRPRPDHLRLIYQGGYSFPSGHAMVSLCLYGFLIYYVYTRVQRKNLVILFTSFFIFLILMIGISRIYLGVHYPSDVLSGYFLSLSILIINISLWNRGDS